jgi:hypothetical protein
MTVAGVVEPTSKDILYASGPSRDYVVWLHGPEKGCLGKAVAAAAALPSSPVIFSCFLFHKYMYTSSTGGNCRVCRCIPGIPCRSAPA